MKFSQNCLKSVLAGMLVCLVAGNWALAQERDAPRRERGERGRAAWRGGGAGGGMMASPAMLLNNAKVQEELELADEQKAEFQEILEKSREGMREAFAGLRDLDAEQRRAKMAELREKMETRAAEVTKQLNEVLLPHQQDRLKQLVFQAQSGRGLASGQVAEQLGLTDEQKEEIGKVRESMREKFREAFAGFREEGGREAAQEKMASLRKEAEEKVSAILTDEQKAKIEELRGKPFEFERPQFRGGQGRGRRGGPERE